MKKDKVKKEKKEKKLKKSKLSDSVKLDLTPKKVLLDLLFYFLGGLLYASAVNIFNSPNNIAQGGATGLAIIVNYLIPVLPIGAVMFVINIPLFITSFIKYGKNFIIKTLVATAMLSVIIDTEAIFIQKYSIIYTGDKLLAALFGGALSGIGLGLIFTRGATTGGTDILGRLLKSAFPHVSMGRLVMAMDICVVLLAGIVYGNIESMLYAVIVFFLSGKAMDVVLYGSDHNKLMQIITEKPDELAAALRANSIHGVTVVPIVDTYNNVDKKMLITAVRANEVTKIRNIVKSVDDRPFIIITDSSEIRGLGFKSLDSKDEI